MLCSMHTVHVRAQTDDAVGRALQSLVWPGMGQLSSGRVVKGLGIMGGQALLISVTVSTLGEISAKALETKQMKVYYNNDIYTPSYTEKKETYNEWQEAYRQWQDAKRNTTMLASAAVAWWVLNVVDAYMFNEPGDASMEGSSTSVLSRFTLQCHMEEDTPRMCVRYTHPLFKE